MTTDKAAAERIGKKLETDAALRRDGVIDPMLESVCNEANRTIEDHLQDFEAKMQAANRGPDHITRTTQLVWPRERDRRT